MSTVGLRLLRSAIAGSVLAGLLLMGAVPAAEAAEATAAASPSAAQAADPEAGASDAGSAETDTAGAGAADPAEDAGSVREAQTEAIADYLISAVGSQWEDDPVAVAPEAVALWDETQRAMLDAPIAALEDDGWTVRVVILPATLTDYDAGLEPSTYRVGWQRGLTELARKDPHAKTVYVLSSARLTTTFSTYESGRLRTELADAYPTGPARLNSEQSAPPVSFVLRALHADTLDLELLPEETQPKGWTGVLYRFHLQDDGIGSAIMGAAFAAAAVVGGLLLALCVVLLLPRNRGPLARLFGTRLDRRHEAAALAALRDDAVRAHRSLTTASRLDHTIETAIGRLPDPAESDSPLVWAGWAELARERAGDHRTRCFYRPDLPAVREESTDLLGAQVTVPVSDLNAERLTKGRAPSFLGLDGIDRGRPYWTRASSPWAASGYGAFGPLSDAIAQMPGDWAPAPGTRRVAEAAQWGATFRADDRATASPWARVVLLTSAAVLALLAGIAGGLHDGKQLEKIWTAELGAPGSPVDDEREAARQAGVRAVEASADGPSIDPYIAPLLVTADMEAVQEVADEVAESTGRDVRVIAHEDTTSGVVSSYYHEDVIAQALPDGALAVLISRSGAEIVSNGVEQDYLNRPERPDVDYRAPLEEQAIAQLRWAEASDWVPMEDPIVWSDEDPDPPGPAPGTPAWTDRVLLRTLLGAGGAALLVLIAGIVFRRLVTDRTDPVAASTGGGPRGKSRQSRRSSSTGDEETQDSPRRRGGGRRRRA